VPETFHYSLMDSPVGPLAIVVSNRGLVGLHFRGRPSVPPKSSKDEWVLDAKRTSRARTELEQYFAGCRREFSIPLDLRGTDFQLSCWRELLKIPYGETRTYADIARAIRSPKAFRAVGMANHDNPVAIIVPCHRVLASGGGLCGYGGGLDIKQKLLELEGARTLALSPR
jgi:methylated-DNA-[protein]-cysteine S-methyltransferase